MRKLRVQLLVAWLGLAALRAQAAPGGLQLYQDGRYQEAAAAFRAASAQAPDAAELQYNLGLALWRAGDLTGAEEAAERYAALPGGGRVDLHRGLLGNVRYAEAKALAARAHAQPAPPAGPQGGPGKATDAPPDPVPLLEQAVAKARQSRDEFVLAAAAPDAAPGLARNVERALQLITDLEQQLEQAKKQREQQKQDKSDKDKNDKSDKNEKNDKDKQQDKKDKQDQKKDQKQDQKQPDDKAKDEKKDANKDEQQQKPPGEKPEPKEPEQGKERPEPKPEQPPPDDKQAQQSQQRDDAPGEQVQASELSPEQKQRLLEQLQKLDQQLKAIRMKARPNQKPVERDW